VRPHGQRPEQEQRQHGHLPLGTLPGGGTATVTINVTPTTKGTLINLKPATVTAANVAADGDDSATAKVTVHGD
jgi:hypothetical protein